MTDTAARRQQTMDLAARYQVLLANQQWDEWIELWGDDAVCEFPYAAADRPQRLVGKTKILGYMRGYPGRFVIDRIEEMVLHETVAGAVLVVELAIKGHVVASGASYDQRYVCIFEVADGLLRRYREYWNPMISQVAFTEEREP
jgi:ketosteroid isomerase-like protein